MAKPNLHDEVHIGLDHLDEVARILEDYAMNYDSCAPLTESRLFFLVHAIEEASGRAPTAARQLPGSPYNLGDCPTRSDDTGRLDGSQVN
jgi:hypothetical protein